MCLYSVCVLVIVMLSPVVTATSSTRNSLLSEEQATASSTGPPPSDGTAELVVPEHPHPPDNDATQEQPHPPDNDTQEKKEQVLPETPTTNITQSCDPSVVKPLSGLLGLKKLWDMLSQCLCSLADTHDNHAVLVLQPAVEAFFLVHAERNSEGKTQTTSRSNHSTSRLRDDTNPVSPAAFSDLSPHPSQSDMDHDQYTQLPEDTALFLQFAGK